MRGEDLKEAIEIANRVKWLRRSMASRMAHLQYATDANGTWASPRSAARKMVEAAIRADERQELAELTRRAAQIGLVLEKEAVR